ncbi:MAG TPA: YcxB family protein [Acholeplasmataceae bacterium]|nr:YcxB family protein [Acholeplasmataceae bacterium]
MVLVIRIAVTNIMLNGVVKKIHYDVISYQLKFKEDGVTYIDDIKSKTFSWNDFIVIYEVENYFYFYISKNSALILAKFVLDEEKRNKLREFIQNTNIKYKKKKFK